MKAAEWAQAYDDARSFSPDWWPHLNEALAAMEIGGTYTVTTFKNLRHRHITGQIRSVSGTELTLWDGKGHKVDTADIVRITCPKGQLDF